MDGTASGPASFVSDVTRPTIRRQPDGLMPDQRSDAPGGSSPTRSSCSGPARGAPARSMAAPSLDWVVRGARARRRDRRIPASPGRRRPRDRPSGRGRVVRPDPVRALAIGLPGRHRRRHRRGAGEAPAPTTSSSSAGGPRRMRSRPRSSAHGRASRRRRPTWPPDSLDEPFVRPRPAGRVSLHARSAVRHGRRRSMANDGRRRRPRTGSPSRPANAYGLTHMLAAPLRVRGRGRSARSSSRGGRPSRGPATTATAPRRRRPRGVGGAVARRLAPGCRGPGVDRRPDRPAEPPLLRRVLRPARPAPARGGRGRRADGRHRPLQGPQRHASATPPATTSCKAVGGAIVAAVRDDDVPARFGGEEFVVLLRNPTERVALEVGERVRASVAALDLRGPRRSRRVACRSAWPSPTPGPADRRARRRRRPGALSRQARRPRPGRRRLNAGARRPRGRVAATIGPVTHDPLERRRPATRRRSRTATRRP